MILKSSTVASVRMFFLCIGVVMMGLTVAIAQLSVEFTVWFFVREEWLCLLADQYS